MIYIIDFGSSKTRAIGTCLRTLGYDAQIIDWDKAAAINLDKASKVILSGSPAMHTEASGKLYKERSGFLKDIQIPMLGICFGHQLLGILYGADVYRGDEERTEIEISILQKNKLFDSFEKSVTMTEDHTEGITLPPGFLHLASSNKYEVEAMKHPDRNIYGVQFHPEVSGDNGLKLLDNFCKII